MKSFGFSVQRSLGSLALAAIAFLFAVNSSFAVGVKPLRNEIVLNPGESKEITIKVINEEFNIMKAVPSIDVYTESDEDGFPIPTDLSENDPRNIESWISFPEEETVLEANSEKEVTFTITAPNDAEPGGKYASIVYEPVVEGDEGVQIRGRVASLILVEVTGDKQISGELSSFGVENVYSDKAIEFGTKFKNTGNVHVKPEGSISLKGAQGQIKQVSRYLDEGGQEVTADEIPVNLEGGNVLPGSTRNYRAEWNENIQEGPVTATLALEYEGKNIEKEISFDTTSKVSIEDVKASINAENVEFVVTLKNDGKIYEKPTGTISITDKYDTEVKVLDLSEVAPDYIAPGEMKKIIAPWEYKVKDGETFAAELSIQHGLKGTEKSQKIGLGQDKEDNTNDDKTEEEEGGFFSTPAGIFVLVVFAVLIFIIFFLLGKKGKK